MSRHTLLRFDLALVARRATPATFQRGCALADRGEFSWTVRHTASGAVRADATFPANRRAPFQVRLVWDGRSLRSRCTCPVRRPRYCSHKVALAVVLQRRLALEGREPEGRAGAEPGVALPGMLVRDGFPGDALRLRLCVRGGMDWFTFSLAARAGDVEIPVESVLEAWRKGRMVLVSPKGGLVRVSPQWFDAHGEALETLLDQPLLAGGARKVPVGLTPLLTEVMEQVAEREVDAAFSTVAERFQALGHPPPVPLPTGLRARLRPYQQEGYAWLQALRQAGVGGILADDMGLGKTLQVLALLLAEKEAGRSGPSLVVAPTSVMTNWQREAARFTPDLVVTLFHGPNRTNLVCASRADLLVTSYALLRKDLEYHRTAGYHYLVLDEAQAVKNPRSATARACFQIPAKHKLAVTGTPIENRLMELWAQFAWLNPGLLGSATRFQKLFVHPIEREGDGHRRATLRQRVEPFILRRVKEAVAPDLPPLTETTVVCELAPDQAALYAATVRAFRERIAPRLARGGLHAVRFAVLDALLKLRLICCHPALSGLDPSGTVQGSGKLTRFREMVSAIVQGGHRVLVFSQFVKMLQVLKNEVEHLGLPYAYLDGNTRNRQQVVDAFNATDTPVFLISLKAGGTGLNLTGADYVILYDPWWNPAVEIQATDRAHRIGQKRPVLAYRLIARGTVEEKMLHLHARKRALAREILPESNAFPAGLDAQDVAHLLEDLPED